MNMGHVMENVAKNHLISRFGNAIKSDHQAFYDFEVVSNGTKTLVEVKWIHVPYKSMAINLRWGQIRQLFNAGDFLLYAMSEKGNVYITPKDIMEFAHVHYNELNPEKHRLFLRTEYQDGRFRLVHPTQCKFCHGTIQEYFARNTTVKGGHKWVPRSRDVRMCPSCKSVRWDRDKDK